MRILQNCYATHRDRTSVSIIRAAEKKSQVQRERNRNLNEKLTMNYLFRQLDERSWELQVRYPGRNRKMVFIVSYRPGLDFRAIRLIFGKKSTIFPLFCLQHSKYLPWTAHRFRDTSTPRVGSFRMKF